MHPFDRTLAPEVTDEELDYAVSADPLPFPDTEQDDADDEPARLFVATIPNTPQEALAISKKWSDEGRFVGIGFCQRAVRNYFNVAALWPDAETDMAHAAPLHRPKPPKFAPRGTAGAARNGHHGHRWINLGGGLVRTTDMFRPGKIDVALESRMLEWCGAIDHAWTELINGVDVWPDPKKPKPKPQPWTWERRVKFLRAEANRQRRDGHPAKANRLTEWADKIAKRHR